MDVAIVCSGLLGLLLFLLSANVSRMRARGRRGVGLDDDPTSALTKAVRAQGNAAEYIPMFVVLFLFLGARQPASWIVVAIILVTACRIAHALGMLLSANLDLPHPLRYAGAAGTYIGGIVLSLALLFEGIA
jgi:hypothetical protein